MKLSVHLIGALLISALLQLPLEARPIPLTDAPDNVCPPPAAVTIRDITSVSARVTWTPPQNTGNVLYYELQFGVQGFTLDGNYFFSGALSDTALVMVGLDPDQNYEAYVRSYCSDDTYSAWVGPVGLRTSPSCGAQIFDPGGAEGDYQNSTVTTTTICPDAPQTTVKLDFSQINLASGDTLRIYDGRAVIGLAVQTLTMASVAPLSVTSLDPYYGCLTLRFKSDAQNVAAGYTADISCQELTGCTPFVALPGYPEIHNITSVSALVTWSPPPGSDAVTYEWQAGPAGFAPGFNPSITGSTAATSVTIGSLEANTLYQFFVRSVCPDNMFSGWSGSNFFLTSPGCGDQIFDSGGEAGDYQNGEKTITTICPDVPGTAVTLDFGQFALADGDTLHVYSGNSVNSPLIVSYDQTYTAPLSVTSSDPGGCLTLQFTSDQEKIEAGYAAEISCAIPTQCFEPLDINVFNLTVVSANFSWPAVIGAIGYEWELQNLQTMVTSSGITLSNTLQISGLSEANFYQFRVRTVCLAGESAWVTIGFFTPINCANKPIIQCGPNTTSGPISASGPGIWNTFACGNPTPTPGKERIFRFVAPHTRMYTFQTIGGSSPDNAYVTYAYKESTAGCGPFDWNCIGSFLVSVNGLTTTFGPLTAGKEYLILFDAETTSFVQHAFRIKDCGPTNDEARTATKLTLDSPCTGNIYSNAQSTFNHIVDTLGIEPNPDVAVVGDDQVSGRWLTSADETVWFKFKAPASGSVVISTESIPQGGNFDTQLALYEAADSSQYPTFKLIASDDDNGDFGLGYNSLFSYSGLTPNATYYIQVDGYSNINGTFCIEVKEGVVRTDDAECLPGYFAENVDGTVPGGDRWYDVYTRPDNLDLGDMVIAVKPGFQDLDSVFARVIVSQDIPFSINEIPYLPAYYNIRSSKTPEMPYSVRLFFHNSEFDSLVARSGLAPGSASIGQLVATYYSGPNEDCTQLNNSYLGSGSGTGEATLITDLKAISMGSSNMFYVEFQIPGNGEIAVHLVQSVLPVELKSFTGKIVDAVNRLEWTTETEKNAAWHIIERSADGIHWSEINRQQGKAAANTPSDYAFDDVRPLQKSYYRLRSTDYDGNAALSSIVVLTRQDALGITRVYPSPTTDHLNILFSTPEEKDIHVRISDITGKIVLEASIFAAKGYNNTALSLSQLPAGVYIVSLSDGSSVVTPVRVVKE